MRPQRFRKKPVEIEAMQWDGSDDCADELTVWTERSTTPEDGGPERISMRFMPLGEIDAEDVLGVHEDKYRRNEGYTAVVYDDEHGTWVNVKTGDWIICGVHGEYYPCSADIFAATYEAVTA